MDSLDPGKIGTVSATKPNQLAELQAIDAMLAERTALRQQVADLTAERDQAVRALRAIELKTGDYPNDRTAVLRQHLYEIELIARSPEIAQPQEPPQEGGE